MSGRHRAAATTRSRLRWLVALGSGAALAAVGLGLSSATAGASSDPVKATFGVTGVATSNCPVSVGGTDVYVQPGQELDVKTSLVGLYVLENGLLTTKKVDLNDVVGQIASLDGSLVIDPGAKTPTRLNITNKVQKVTGLRSGAHRWKWTVSKVKLLNLLPLPLHIESKLLKSGAKLTWTGTIHVTSNAARCGVAVQLPSVSASASVKGLPPVRVGVPGVKVSVPVSVPTSLPGVGSRGGNGGHSSSAPSPSLGNPIPVPAQVVPAGDAGGPAGGGGGGLLGGLLGAGPNNGGGAAATSGAAPAAPLAQQNSAGKHKNIDLAASQPSSTGQLWVVLAIVAVIALAFVAATYARLYLMKRE